MDQFRFLLLQSIRTVLYQHFRHASQLPKAGAEVDTNSAYWMYKTLAVVVEPRYHKFINEVNEYRDGCQSFGLQRIDQIDQQAAELEVDELNNFLTKANLQTAAEVTKRTHSLLSSLIKQSLLDSKYQFELGDNL